MITRGERRRRWTIEQKQTIAAQSLAPGASPTEVARQYGISSGQLYTWRHALLAVQPEVVTRTAGRFARVEVKAVRMAEHVSQEAAIEAPSLVPQLLANPTAQPSGRIEIVLADGTAVRMDAQVDEIALRRVLAVLRVRAIRKAGNDRPAVIFIPRIDLAQEAAERMRAIAPDLDVRVWLGRSLPGMCSDLDSIREARDRMLDPQRRTGLTAGFRGEPASRVRDRSWP